MQTRRTKVKEMSKTERIANVFKVHPFESISPKEISGELGMEIQLVTSIVSRLRAEGLIERVSWGKYRLRMEQTLPEETLNKVANDYQEISRNILSTSDVRSINNDTRPLDLMVQIYIEVMNVGGEIMAQNMLRLAARKSISPEDAEVLLSSIKEVQRT
ncbi:MAG: hypothetical protein JXA22_04855 [Candidatus Thermoplasmatota archaeon]|nr:hypothetical protein [Candidatus Thermoplasmatota archaeon]